MNYKKKSKRISKCCKDVGKIISLEELGLCVDFRKTKGFGGWCGRNDITRLFSPQIMVIRKVAKKHKLKTSDVVNVIFAL